MGNKLSSLKNLIWAAAIVLCLLALIIGIIFSMASKYYGPKDFPILYLSGAPEGAAGGGADGQSGEGEDGAETPQGVQSGTGELMELAEAGDAGQEYLDSLTFLCDSALVGIRDYGLLSGGLSTTQVWGSDAGNIPYENLSECMIKYPGDGSVISAANAAMIAKPKTLIISVGTDGLAGADKDGFIYNYTLLVLGIRAANPETVIVCSSMSSVINGYGGTDGLSPSMIGEANEWVRQVCRDTGAYFLDAASAVNDSGFLDGRYASSNGKTLNSEGLTKVLEYIRCHPVPVN